MSDDSFTDFRQADGRFAKGNPGGPGRPHARERIAALDQRVAEADDDLIDAAAAARVIKAHGDLVDFEPRLLELKAQIERQRGERRWGRRFSSV